MFTFLSRFHNNKGKHEMALKITCGFGRVGVRETKVLGLSEEERKAARCSQGNLEQRYKAFRTIFGEGKENELSFEDFCTSVDYIKKVFKNWSGGCREEKAKFLEYFSLSNWKKLNKATKQKHSIVGPCKACLLDHGTHWDFYNKQIKCTRVRNELNDSIPQLTQVKRILAEVQQIEVNIKKNERAKKRKYASELKRSFEEAQRVNNKDVEVAYGNTESLRARKNRRLAEEFETRAEAETRTKKRKRQEETGQRKCKKRLGNFDDWGNFDRDALKEEVNSLEDGTAVNWTQLARKYDIKGLDGKPLQNAGQLLKLWLQKEDINTDRFQQQSPAVRVRRARQRVVQGSDLTLPKKRTEREISKEMSKMIESGEVPIGEFVVPRTYEKFYLNKDGNRIETKIITTAGRKKPLHELRQYMLETELPFMRDATNCAEMTTEELQQGLMDLGEYHEGETEGSMRHRLESFRTTRNLMYWEDGATLANHGYILYLFSTIYDEAIHLTDTEYEQKFNLKISVQSAVEQPHVYLIARSGSSDAEQLLYAQTRRDDLPSLSFPVTTPDGREFKDVLRFFKGDNPSRQFEMGQQRGGFHPCLCPADSRMMDSPSACNDPVMTIQDRQQFLLEGPITSQKASSSLPEPFSQMSKEELKDELTYRGEVPYDRADSMTKKDLQQGMKHVLRGIKRSPTLLQPDPTQDITEINLQKLEIPASESMHDLYNHTKNIFEELPKRVPKVAETIETVRKTTLGNKDTVRASDMRHFLVLVTKELEQQGQAEENVMKLLHSLVEMQRLCYAAADKRDMTSIYRMQNTMHVHNLMMKEIFPGDPKSITKRKLWGSYIHSLRDHTPIVYRVAPISSLLAENEERQFGTFKRITKASANYANEGQIITNLMVKTHIHNKNGGTRGQQNNNNKISQVAKLFSQPRTRIPVALLQKYPRDTQTYVERVSDFMQEGYGQHWHIEEEELVLHDAPSDTPLSAPQHYRSTSINEVHHQLKQSFEECLQKGVPLPASKIWIYEGQSLSKKVKTPFLETGYSFTNQKFNYYNHQPAEEETTSEEESESVEETEEDTEDETEEETVIRMERLDPKPELEQFEDTAEITM
ncbi:uncharacterized protein LOC118407344 [Branchiostoma floridae]|uniref:Uncharacterized protein LOC118407344 n=1 Tax=Branchiostoma floridae TaxID=7739 RepID=A0A9J7HPY9_BRAFL|nr:uncharacterized protein LOC118407344 [Branchiostoma floridae]